MLFNSGEVLNAHNITNFLIFINLICLIALMLVFKLTLSFMSKKFEQNSDADGKIVKRISDLESSVEELKKLVK